jgi:hypothetical protein
MGTTRNPSGDAGSCWQPISSVAIAEVMNNRMMQGTLLATYFKRGDR